MTQVSLNDLGALDVLGALSDVGVLGSTQVSVGDVSVLR